jgi:hypothetical protein
MKQPSQEESRAGAALDRGQGGARFLPFMGSDRLRHAQLGSWWERILAILALIFVVVTLGNIILGTL